MIRRLYDWTMSLADRPHALWALGAVAFAESSFFPIPPDLLMVPMILANPRRAWTIAGVALAASVAGAVLGYWIGHALFESVGRPVLEFYGQSSNFAAFRQRYQEWGPWVVLMAGATPFPYKVITILSGATALNFGVFVLASIVARGVKFFLVAALLWRFGDPIRDFIERWLTLVFTAAVVVVIAGFYAVKYL